LFLEYYEAGTNQIVQNFYRVWRTVGIALVLLGLEILAINAKMFGKTTQG
jgi:hypothetical protein